MKVTLVTLNWYAIEYNIKQNPIIFNSIIKHILTNITHRIKNLLQKTSEHRYCFYIYFKAFLFSEQ